ncbi:MAG: tRNA (cytidine(34)-2'-O)-methyltransferase [Bdellovibrionales bacterium]|nr:tRNA (cytidine(34)-2'-O)-methyltransferase [Bdellovibrionales bacterium]
MKIVLIEPEIPQNTGSIARTCAATNVELHLVGKLGFDISEKAVRRAGLDYWPHVQLYQHGGWQEFLEEQRPMRCWYFSTHARTSIWEALFHQEDVLVFGSETRGLGEAFRLSVPQEQLLMIPIDATKVRSLNLSNAVSIALYEALRQTGGLVTDRAVPEGERS